MEGLEALTDNSQTQPQAPAPAPSQPQAAPGAAVNPNQPHARLLSMIQSLAVGLDSFATAAATHGREGGAEEVQNFYAKQQAAKNAQDANARANQESTDLHSARIAQTNLETLRLQQLQQAMPFERAKAVNDLYDHLFKQYTEAGDLPGVAAQKARSNSQIVAMVPGQNMNDHAQAVLNAAGPSGVGSNLVLPVHNDASELGSGKTAVVPVGSGIKVEQSTFDNSMRTLNNELDVLGRLTIKGKPGSESPEYKQAQAVLGLMAKGGTNMNLDDFSQLSIQAMSMIHQPQAREQAVNQFNEKQAQAQKAQQEADPLFKLETDPGQMAGEKSSAAIPLLQNKLSDPATLPEDKVRATRLLSQAKSAHQNFLNDQVSKANADQQAKQGDPAAAGALLADGSLTLADLKTRGMTPKFMTQAINAARGINKDYKPADEIIAEQVAKSPQANQFFGSANSLISKGGTLDQVMEQGAKLPNHKWPVFNSIADAKNYQTGHPEVAGYLQTALGAADDYAKVMGGGQGTEGMQLHVLNGLTAALNQDMRKAVTDGMRGAVNSQVESRIGKNQFLKRAYGYALPSAQAQFDPSKLPNAN